VARVINPDAPVIFCGLWADSTGTVPGSVMKHCTLCGEEICVSPSSMHLILTEGARLVCIPCAPGFIATQPGEAQWQAFPAQQAEMAALGMTPAEQRRVGKDMIAMLKGFRDQRS
jgi:hypothetical protein